MLEHMLEADIKLRADHDGSVHGDGAGFSGNGFGINNGDDNGDGAIFDGTVPGNGTGNGVGSESGDGAGDGCDLVKWADGSIHGPLEWWHVDHEAILEQINEWDANQEAADGSL